jgi:GDP-mannose 6-dehydrogenase
MRVSVFGLGYVGSVCTACLADFGHQVIGVDVVRDKIEMINNGIAPVVEPDLDALLTKGVKRGLISATMSVDKAVSHTDISLVTVPTPSLPNGALNMAYIERSCGEIGEAIKKKNRHHTVVIRSTVLPGSLRNTVIPVLEKSTGKKAGIGFGLAVNPEFLRESTAITDFKNPSMTVIGCLDEISAEQLKELYSKLNAPLFVTSLEVAELVKYACNSWHAVKIAFANEIGSIAKACNIDGREVMEIFCNDTRLNISSYYLRPGFAFGGSCLPKDIRALTYLATRMDVKHPLLSSVMPSNENHIQNSFRLIEKTGKRKIGFLGLSFKADTDDLREAPQVELIEKLLGKGYKIMVYDANINYARVHGSNKEYIEKRIPHIASLLKDDMDTVIYASDLIVIANGNREFASVFDKINDHHVLDLNGFMRGKSSGNIQGICW